MPFEKALYYPYIDIQDETWLKTSLFYWDKIQTIVPDYMENPYKSGTGSKLFNAGILTPHYVNSGMDEIENLTDVIVKYLTTPEGKDVLLNKDTNDDQNYYIYTTKLPNSIKKLLEKYQIQEQENNIDKFEKQIEKSIDKIKLDKTFTDFYMTLLAANISENINAELLTDTDLNDELAKRVKLDYDTLNLPNITKGTLVNMIFKKIEIDPKTSIEKIISFRDNHSYDILNFRNKIIELSNTVSNSSYDEIHENAEYTYKYEFLPAQDSLKESLRDNKIKWAAIGSVSVSTVVSSLITLAPNPSYEHIPILNTIGMSLAAFKIRYNMEKKSILKENPYSYILSVENEFRKKPVYKIF